MADERSRGSEKEARDPDMNSTDQNLPASFETLASLIRSGQVPSEIYESWLKNAAFRRFYARNFNRLS